MRDRPRRFASLLLGLALWTSLSAGRRVEPTAERFIGASHALAMGAEGMPSSAVHAVRASARLSHPAPLTTLASCAAALALGAPPHGHQRPSTNVESPARPAALAFPYDATAPPARFES